MESRTVSTQTLQRLPLYLNYLKTLPVQEQPYISAAAVARALDLNQVQVRKDLALVGDGGKPKVGYQTESLIADLEKFLGYDDSSHAVLAGVGHLGRALLSYEGFQECGMEIVAGFDIRDDVLGEMENGIKVLPVGKMQSLCRRLNIKIGIIAVPEEAAQEVCDLMVESGILAIWNFAPIHLTAPEQVMIQNENMVSSLAVLTMHLEQTHKEYGQLKER